MVGQEGGWMALLVKERGIGETPALPHPGNITSATHLQERGQVMRGDQPLMDCVARVSWKPSQTPAIPLIPTLWVVTLLLYGTFWEVLILLVTCALRVCL